MINQDDKTLFEFLSPFGEQKDYPKRSIIMEEGKLARNFYLLKKGLVRGWTNHQGKEITFQFVFEGYCFCNAKSFFANDPCSYTVETIEESTLLVIKKSKIDELCCTNTKFLKLFNSYLISRVVAYQNLLISRIQDKPESRYKKLLKENPEILLRVPQHYIASYLGITPVSLSRIKGR